MRPRSRPLTPDSGPPRVPSSQGAGGVCALVRVVWWGVSQRRRRSMSMAQRRAPPLSPPTTTPPTGAQRPSASACRSELVHQGHLRAPVVARDPDGRAPDPARRARQARRVRGDQGRDQVHEVRARSACMLASVTAPSSSHSPLPSPSLTAPRRLQPLQQPTHGLLSPRLAHLAFAL
jgi:hypothetical protein